MKCRVRMKVTLDQGNLEKEPTHQPTTLKMTRTLTFNMMRFINLIQRSGKSKVIPQRTYSLIITVRTKKTESHQQIQC